MDNILFSNVTDAKQKIAYDDEGNRLKKDDWHKKHPWYYKGKVKRSIEAHHLIVSESVRSPSSYKPILEKFGYDINCKENGVMLPFYMDLACHLTVPLHRGNHDQGEGLASHNYPDSVIVLLKELSAEIESGSLCESGNSGANFKSQINKISNNILGYISNFDWTIGRDGKDFEKDSPIGCGNVENIGDNKDKECNYRSNNETHQFYDVEKRKNIIINKRNLSIGK
ncbi:AHH domain-containing protein [Marinicellulosiphila megalodicopiae]|uniref:AHH domain-containing protein n=1 Tax=Marinicellulosiphila megalodicopiae TaxID=2724896 RepID=UPI003BAF6403